MCFQCLFCRCCFVENVNILSVVQCHKKRRFPSQSFLLAPLHNTCVVYGCTDSTDRCVLQRKRHRRRMHSLNNRTDSWHYVHCVQVWSKQLFPGGGGGTTNQSYWDPTEDRRRTPQNTSSARIFVVCDQTAFNHKLKRKDFRLILGFISGHWPFKWTPTQPAKGWGENVPKPKNLRVESAATEINNRV